METGLIRAGVALLTGFCLCSSTMYAGRGGGHGGGGGAPMASSGGNGARSGPMVSSGARVSGVNGMRGYSGTRYSGMNGARMYSAGNARVYTGKGVGGVYGGNVIRGSTVVHSTQGLHSSSHVTSHRVTRTGMNQNNALSANLNKGQSTNRVHHVTGNNSTRRLDTAGVSKAKRNAFVSPRTITTRDGKSKPGTWARNNPRNKTRFDAQTQSKLRNWQGRKSSFAEAKQRARGDNNEHDHHGHNHHDHDWWHHHCDSIILVDWGWWGWWDGWWYPCWGYDPYYSNYDYDGPIYGGNGLPPDEIVANVQNELQRLGYFSYTADGVLGPLTQDALMRYQRDHGLPITGAVDQTTIGSLHLG